MSWLQRFVNVLRPNRLGQDLQRELAFHLEERANQLQDDGLTQAEAIRKANWQFGNFTGQMERTRDMDITILLDSLIRNLRYAIRSFFKAPAFTAAIVITLALAIGANTAVFSAIYAVLLRPLPFPESDRLIKLDQIQEKQPQSFVAPARLEDWNRLNKTFTGITGYYTEDISETSGEYPERLTRAWVAPRFLSVLQISPALGRDFDVKEQRFGGPPAALISDRLWRRRFGSNPLIVGKSLRIGTGAYRIVGVMPQSFQYPAANVDLWAPSPPDAPYAQGRKNTWYTAIGRLNPGSSIQQAHTDLSKLQGELGQRYGSPDSEISISLVFLKEVSIGGVRKSLWLLFGSVTLLLVIACANIAALLLSRGTARQQETAVRFSLGASRSAIIGQFLTEVIVLSLTGALLGLCLAAGASRVFRSLASNLPRVQDIGLNGTILIYSILCAVAAALLCGVWPAIRFSRQSLAASLAQGGRTRTSARNSAQFALVGIQVALAVTLLSGAALLLRSFHELGRVSPGFDAQHVLTFHLSSSWAETTNRDAQKQRTQRILSGLGALPGISTAAVAANLPGVPTQHSIEVQTKEGRGDTEPKMLAEPRWVTPGYFSALGIPLMAGEPCRDEPKATTVMVNQVFAHRYLGGTAALGRHLFQPGNPSFPEMQIRGIVGNARENGLDHDPPPAVYSCTGTLQPGIYFLVKTQNEVSGLGAAIRRKIHELEPQRSLYDLKPLNDIISDGYAEGRLRTVLLTCFAFTAVLLAGVGLYGSLSYLVSLQRREIAVRLAIGGRPSEVLWMFLKRGLTLASIGCIAGISMVIVSGKLLRSMLYGVASNDVPTLAAVILAILGIAGVASFLPAFRASHVNPMQALREE